MFLDDLLEARVVELGKLGEVVDVGDDVAQVFLEQVKVLLVLVGVPRILLGARDCIVDLLLGCCDATNDFLGLDALERVDLVELLLKLLDEALLRLFVPDVMDAQRVLQAFIVDVVEDPLLVERLLKLLAESANAH